MELLDSWPWVTSRCFRTVQGLSNHSPLKCRRTMRAKSISLSCPTFVCCIYLFTHLGKVFWNIYMCIFLNMCMYVCIHTCIHVHIHGLPGWAANQICFQWDYKDRRAELSFQVSSNSSVWILGCSPTDSRLDLSASGPLGVEFWAARAQVRGGAAQSWPHNWTGKHLPGDYLQQVPGRAAHSASPGVRLDCEPTGVTFRNI